MQMLSERGFNIHVYPMIQKRGRKFEGDYVKKDSMGRVAFKATEDSRWNIRCYKFMDYMSTKLRKAFDIKVCKIFPDEGLIKSIEDPRMSSFVLASNPGMIYNVIEGVNNPNSQYGQISAPYVSTPKINIKEAAKYLKWKKSDVVEAIKMISNFKFKTDYHFKTSKSYGKIVHNGFGKTYSNFRYDYETMFNCSFNDDNSICTINLNTGFGICFLHNIYTGGYQLFDESLYELSESAQIVYRTRFFIYDTLPHVHLSKNYVMNLLGIKTKNLYNEKLLFRKIMDEIIEKTSVRLNSINEDNLCYDLCKLKTKRKKSNIVDLNSQNKTFDSKLIKNFV